VSVNSADNRHGTVGRWCSAGQQSTRWRQSRLGGRDAARWRQDVASVGRWRRSCLGDELCSSRWCRRHLGRTERGCRRSAFSYRGNTMWLYCRLFEAYLSTHSLCCFLACIHAAIPALPFT
jgi:hypothetical protein